MNKNQLDLMKELPGIQMKAKYLSYLILFWRWGRFCRNQNFQNFVDLCFIFFPFFLACHCLKIPYKETFRDSLYFEWKFNTIKLHKYAIKN